MYMKYSCPEQAKTHRVANKTINDLKEIIAFLAQNNATHFVFCITKCTQTPSVVIRPMQLLWAEAMPKGEKLDV